MIGKGACVGLELSPSVCYGTSPWAAPGSTMSAPITLIMLALIDDDQGVGKMNIGWTA